MSAATDQSSIALSPSDLNIEAAEELELTDEPLSDDDLGKDKDEKVAPKSPSRSLKVAPSSDTSPTSPKSPIKTPSKVKAAAAMWEKGGGGGASPGDRDGIKNTPTPTASSFRSIPASSSKSTLPAWSNNTPTKSGAKPPFGKSPSTHTVPLNESPTKRKASSSGSIKGGTQPDPVPTEAFAEVSLNNAAQLDPATSDDKETKSYSLTPTPPTVDLEEELEDVPVEETKSPPTGKPSFFSSALGLGSSSTASPSSANIASPKPSRSTSSTSNGTGTGWRSAMSNILGPRASTTPSPGPSTAINASVVSSTPPPLSATGHLSPQSATMRSASTGFIVNRMDSPIASRDRRTSRQDGGDDKLREGFEKVRSEMEDAARDMRREEGKSDDTGQSQRHSTSNVDWVFWGAVVQDYEEVARTRPRDLSRAIQQGIPPVIRGAIWQLMSSSKSTPLEETYKALLKMSSPHEKAIAKDINRTFPNHKFFQECGGVGQESLFMVVKAFSLYDEDVGYTQGLAFIVAALLLNMPDEEAFCVLVRLMDSYNLRSLFLADMPGLQLRLFQFDRLVEEILPLVHTHFIRKGVKSSMFASQWFMTLFSYRFPLSLVYRVLDIVFAEGIEAIFRFSLALLRKSEDKIVELDFEQILQFLQVDLFEVYRHQPETQASDAEVAVSSKEVEDGGKQEKTAEEGDWRDNEFVRDAYDIRITPFMLDSYEAEYDELCRTQNKHALELDQLRNANRNLSAQVKQLEASLANMNQEHVELVRQLVMSKIDKEDTENELVRYKMLYAELAHAQQDALSNHSRLSAGSVGPPRET